MKKGFGLVGVLIVVGVIAVLSGGSYYYLATEDTFVETPEENEEEIIPNITEELEDENKILNENTGKGIPSEAIGNLSIDNCKSLSSYKQEKWYSNFKAKIENLDFYSQADAERLFEMNKHSYNSPQDLINQKGKHTIEDVDQICYADGDYLFAIIPSEYGGGGFKFIVYDTEFNTIDIAKREDVDGGKDTPWYLYKKNSVEQRNKIIKTGTLEQVKDVYKWFGTPGKFEEIQKENIKLSGQTGDAGCGSKYLFNYSLKENYINIEKSCFFCEGDEEETCNSF